MRDPKIQFYQSLSTLLKAGVPIIRAVQTASRALRGSWRRMALSLETDLRRGITLAESMEHKKRFFDSLEVELIRTGEQTGQLAEMVEQLGEWRQFLLHIKRIFFSGMALPVFILHAAAMVIPIPILGKAFLSGEGTVMEYFYSVGRILLSFYLPAAIAAVLVAWTPSQGPLRRMYDAFLCAIPLLGKAVIHLALSRYAKTFAMLYGAGIPIIQAAEQATRNCGNWVVAQRLKGGYLNTKKGLPMSAGFAPTVDPEFREIWLVGEETGELDQCARRLGNMYAEQAELRFKTFARGFPIMVYLILLMVLAFVVIQGFLSIYGSILSF